MGITTIQINTMDELHPLLFDHPFDESISRHRDNYVYRGICDASFKLLTSLQRICKQKSKELEPRILENFGKYAELEDDSIKNSIWRKMILGQHHGLPTRLLDWSKSPLIALHFATTEGDMDNLDRRDCVVWRLDVDKLHQMLPQEYRDLLRLSGQKVFNMDMMAKLCPNLKEYDDEMNGQTMVILEPPSMDFRMMNQYSFFSVVPSDVGCVDEILEKCGDAVVRYEISKNLRWQIRDFLDQANVNERIVYPGLDGIATWLSRYYFVRNAARMHIDKTNLLTLKADAIVSPTSRNLVFKGMDRQIAEQVGESRLRAALHEFPQCEVGHIYVTEGFGLKAPHIIHARSPRWYEHDQTGSKELLAQVYRNCLEWLYRNELHSIGFPLLSAGYRGFDEKVAWRIGLETCKKFMDEHPGYPIDITFCVINENSYAIGQNIYNELMHIDVKLPEVHYGRRREYRSY